MAAETRKCFAATDLEAYAEPRPRLQDRPPVSAGLQREIGGAMLPSELRAARGLLGWAQTELSDRSGVAIASIRRFEIGTTGLTDDSMKAIIASVRRAGVGILSEMNEGVGAKLLR